MFRVATWVLLLAFVSPVTLRAQVDWSDLLTKPQQPPATVDESHTAVPAGSPPRSLDDSTRESSTAGAAAAPPKVGRPRRATDKKVARQAKRPAPEDEREFPLVRGRARP
jgi:hypothetical protein